MLCAHCFNVFRWMCWVIGQGTWKGATTSFVRVYPGDEIITCCWFCNLFVLRLSYSYPEIAKNWPASPIPVTYEKALWHTTVCNVPNRTRHELNCQIYLQHNESMRLGCLGGDLFLDLAPKTQSVGIPKSR